MMNIRLTQDSLVQMETLLKQQTSLLLSCEVQHPHLKMVKACIKIRNYNFLPKILCSCSKHHGLHLDTVVSCQF